MRSTFILALLVLSAVPAFAGDLEDAQALQQAGKFEDALPKYQAAAKADPASAPAALGLSQVLAGLGRYDEAARAVDAARKAHPENASLAAAKGRAYLLRLAEEEQSSERDDNLVESLKADADRWAGLALKADKANVDALLLKSELHRRNGNTDQALLFIQEAMKNDPKSFDAAYALANHWFLLAGKDNKNKELWVQAEYAFFAAMKLDPKSVMAALNHAHCKAWQNLPGKSVADAYRAALALSPADESILKRVFQYTPVPERVAVFQQLSDEMPKDVTRRLYLASAYSGVKEFGKALDVLEAASKLEPANPFVPLNEGDVKMAEGKNLDAAVDFYCEAITLFKDRGSIDDAVYIRLAGPVAFENPKLEKPHREKLWTLLWKYFPQRPAAMNNAGFWYRDIGKDYDKSIEWYLRAAKAAPEDACIQNDTGLIYQYHLNDFDKAEPFYRKAVEIGNRDGLDCTAARKEPDRGFHDALNNLHIILAAQKRWEDLAAFAKNEVPETHPFRDMWIKEAQEKK